MMTTNDAAVNHVRLHLQIKFKIEVKLGVEVGIKTKTKIQLAIFKVYLVLNNLVILNMIKCNLHLHLGIKMQFIKCMQIS